MPPQGGALSVDGCRLSRASVCLSVPCLTLSQEWKLVMTRVTREPI